MIPGRPWTAPTAVELREAARDSLARCRQWLADWKEPRWRAGVGRGLLYVLVALLPLNAGLVALHVPSSWKEAVIAAALVVALTLPARARVGRVDWLLVAYFALVILSAATHFVTNLADLAPYFVYVPLGFILPRLLVTSRQVKTMLLVAAGSLLLNAAWMVAVRRGIIAWPDLVSVVGPTWNVSGSLTGSGLTTATLFGVGAGLGWVVGKVTHDRLRIWLLSVVFTFAAAMTGSREAIVTSGVGLILLIVIVATRLSSKARSQAVLALLAVMLLFAATFLGPHFVRADDSVRVARWGATLRLAWDNPLLGAGPGATSLSRVIRDLDLNPISNLPDNIVGNRLSENSVIKVAAEVGLPAFLAITIWIASVIGRAVPPRPAALYGGHYELVGPLMIVLTVVDGLTSANMESFVGATLFWFGVGLCRSRLDDVDYSRQTGPPDPKLSTRRWSIRQSAVAWRATLGSLTPLDRTKTRSA